MRVKTNYRMETTKCYTIICRHKYTKQDQYNPQPTCERCSMYLYVYINGTKNCLFFFTDFYLFRDT